MTAARLVHVLSSLADGCNSPDEPGPSLRELLLESDDRNPRLLCRAALALLSAPGADLSARTLGMRCLLVLCRLLEGDDDGRGGTIRMAETLLPCLASAVGRAERADAARASEVARGAKAVATAEEARRLRWSSVGLVARAWCASGASASMIPAAALPHVAASLLQAGDEGHGSSGDGSSGDGSSGDSIDLADLASPPTPSSALSARGLHLHTASTLASTPLGLLQLAGSGVARRRSVSLVETAQRGDDDVAALHERVLPGARAPIFDALCGVAALFAWPHAVPLAITDVSSGDGTGGGSARGATWGARGASGAAAAGRR